MGPRYCDHTFFKIETKTVGLPTGPVTYAKVCCVYCGQVRELHDNGDVIIRVEEGKIIKKKNEQPNDTSQKI